ncbi:homologous recombination OB-fold protein [Erethizon dorsatum]
MKSLLLRTGYGRPGPPCHWGDRKGFCRPGNPHSAAWTLAAPHIAQDTSNPQATATRLPLPSAHVCTRMSSGELACGTSESRRISGQGGDGESRPGCEEERARVPATGAPRREGGWGLGRSLRRRRLRTGAASGVDGPRVSMHQHHPEPAHARLESGPGPPCSRASPALTAVPPQARSPRTLFSVDEEFEDEDFLSAVEIAENQIAGALPRPAGHLRPASSSPWAAVRAPSPRPPALSPLAAVGPRRPPTPGLCHTAPSVPGAVGGLLRPVRPEGAWEGLARDELDEVLAGLELDLGAGAEGPAPAKRARVLDLSESASCSGAAPPLQEPPEPSGPRRTPQPLLRPGATWAGATLTGHIPELRGTSGAPGHCSPWSPGPWWPLPAPHSWAGGKPCPPEPQVPGAHSSATSGTGPAVSPGAPASPAVSPISTPRGPRSSLQTPVVTNHLVQLVTAATRTPALARTRRFPGPAGLLPQQRGRMNPEEIVVSTPQTPAHGALAKLRTEIVTSSQVPVEEDFGCGPWLAMKVALGLDDGDPACFLRTCSVAMVLRKAALKQLPGNKVPAMAVMVKSLTRSTVDASVVLRDPTGEMQGTVHRALLEARQGELKPGAVLLLQQVGVFSPSLRNHYLNVTPSNLVHIYSPDSGDRDLLRPLQPIPEGPGSPQGRCQPDVAAQPGPGLGPRVTPEEEAPDTDDLDGLLSELPEDFFSGSCGSRHPEAGPL